MPEDKEGTISFQNVLDETQQGHNTRKPIYKKLEQLYNLPVFSFCTSFTFPATIHDKDADMIEAILQASPVREGFLLIINSPGGSALAAERIIKVCNTYSNGKFIVVVPKMAKSAATMICLGAQKILMSPTSELGPIDPQVIISDGQTKKLFPADLVVESYKKLIAEAIRVKQPIEIFLQQLSKYDARDIAMYEREAELSRDIACRALKTGMLKDKDAKFIEKVLKVFAEPIQTKSHGRPIYLEEIKEAGLQVEEIGIGTEHWKALWDLYLRIDFILNRTYAKIVESKDHSYVIQAGR